MTSPFNIFSQVKRKPYVWVYICTNMLRTKYDINQADGRFNLKFFKFHHNWWKFLFFFWEISENRISSKLRSAKTICFCERSLVLVLYRQNMFPGRSLAQTFTWSEWIHLWWSKVKGRCDLLETFFSHNLKICTLIRTFDTNRRFFVMRMFYRIVDFELQIINRNQ